MNCIRTLLSQTDYPLLLASSLIITWTRICVKQRPCGITTMSRPTHLYFEALNHRFMSLPLPSLFDNFVFCAKLKNQVFPQPVFCLPGKQIAWQSRRDGTTVHDSRGTSALLFPLSWRFGPYDLDYPHTWCALVAFPRFAKRPITPLYEGVFSFTGRPLHTRRREFRFLQTKSKNLRFFPAMFWPYVQQPLCSSEEMRPQSLFTRKTISNCALFVVPVCRRCDDCVFVNKT